MNYSLFSAFLLINGICTMLSRYLSNNGFRTAVASSGSGMMSRLEQDTYDLILLDLNLGVEDGLDLLRELHARGRSRIIVISGRKNPVDRVVGLELVADDYVCKPFHLREVLARERRCVLSTLRHARIAAAPKLARLSLSKGGKPLSNMWLGNPANRRRIQASVGLPEESRPRSQSPAVDGRDSRDRMARLRADGRRADFTVAEEARG